MPTPAPPLALSCPAPARPPMAPALPSPAEQAPLRPSFAKVAAAAVLQAPRSDASARPRPPVATPQRPLASHSAPPSRPSAGPEISLPVVEDGRTQLSSSAGSAKPPSMDGTSVVSATACALDEKESLRPDDSASLRAVDEEDVVSPPGSLLAAPHHDSDPGAARAFRDQLHEIAVMNPQPSRGVAPGRFPTLPIGPHALYDPGMPLGGAPPVAPPVAHGPPNMPAIPDEKLLEALQSPRDRLFVVKIEQDFIDFIKDSRESEYSLPNCNTFYRMLAHRLADYYLLGHVVDNTMTGVKITRTPYCRIPPPVSQMVDPSKGNSTPPVELPARKIMRRDDGKSGTSTTANSQNPSKTTSEIGGSEGSNDGTDVKDKAALTREEREARYREARKRIFGEKSDEPEPADGLGSGDDKDKHKDVSRSSSASGKKKTGKKQRNYDDDDFQARSRFNAYYPQQYPVAPGYSTENVVYYNNFSAPTPNAPYSNMNTGASPPQSLSNPYPSMIMSPEAQSQSQYGWNGQQYPSPNGSPMLYAGYGQTQNGYDLSADFQRGMSSFQNAGMPSQLTPKMANPQMAACQDTYQPPPPSQIMSSNSGWSPMPQQASYPIAPNSYAPSGPGHRSLSGPQQPQAPGPCQYPFPPNGYGGKPNRNQHPVPGSYTRPQFNPQTQSFIPHGMPAYMAQGPPQMPGCGGFPTPGQLPMSTQMARPSPSTHSTPPFGSPQSMQANSCSGPSMNRMASQQSSEGGAPRQNSIAKYGTPSHLPPKPPAPAAAATQPSGTKFALPSMAGVPSNLSSGVGHHGQAGLLRNSSGPAAAATTASAVAVAAAFNNPTIN